MGHVYIMCGNIRFKCMCPLIVSMSLDWPYVHFEFDTTCLHTPIA